MPKLCNRTRKYVLAFFFKYELTKYLRLEICVLRGESLSFKYLYIKYISIPLLKAVFRYTITIWISVGG